MKPYREKGWDLIDWDLNEYVVGLYIKGKNRLISTEYVVEADDKDAAINKAKKQLLDEGLQYGGWDYCDLI